MNTELFPPTPEERLAAVRTHLAEEVDKRQKADDSAMSKLYEAQELLETFDEAMKGRAGTGRSVLEVAADMVNSGALDGDGLTVTASVSPGRQNVPDVDPVVVVLWPDDDEPHVTEVGDHTAYVELVADYFTAAGIDGDLEDWAVLAEDELSTNGGGGRNPKAYIQERDYGKRLLIRKSLSKMSNADLITSYRRLLDLTTNRETCDEASLKAFDAHCEEMERRGMDLDPASLDKRLREAKAATA